jgi:bla regulator protein BlaR1
MNFIGKVAALGCMACAGAVDAQIVHAKGAMPSFEVATVKPWQPSAAPVARVEANGLPQKVMKMAPAGGVEKMTDRVHFIGQAEILIESAYGLPLESTSRVLGAPNWVRSEGERYEVQAKIEESAFAAMQKMTAAEQHEQVSLMEQSLLAERFGMKVHFETRELPVYELVVAKGGPKLAAAKAGEVSKLSIVENEQGSEITAQAVTLEAFLLSPLLHVGGRPVLDKTGLGGRYDFVLKTSGNESGSAESEGESPSVFKALQEQLGLRLVPAKGPVEVIVIDHIERPSAN